MRMPTVHFIQKQTAKRKLKLILRMELCCALLQIKRFVKIRKK